MPENKSWPYEQAEANCEFRGVTITICTGVDGAAVVFIDTDEERLACTNDHDEGPAPLRILLNEHPIYENPPYPEN